MNGGSEIIRFAPTLSFSQCQYRLDIANVMFSADEVRK